MFMGGVVLNESDWVCLGQMFIRSPNGCVWEVMAETHGALIGVFFLRGGSWQQLLPNRGK